MKVQRHRPMSDINVVPYIDVMLVLLIIFMITAPVITTQVPVDLPNASAKPITPRADRFWLVVSLTRAGEYLIERDDLKLESVKLSEVVAYVKQIMVQRPEVPVYVQGDQSVAYGKVIELMAALQSAGAFQVGLVTEAVH